MSGGIISLWFQMSGGNDISLISDVWREWYLSDFRCLAEMISHWFQGLAGMISLWFQMSGGNDISLISDVRREWYPSYFMCLKDNDISLISDVWREWYLSDLPLGSCLQRKLWHITLASTVSWMYKYFFQYCTNKKKLSKHNYTTVFLQCEVSFQKIN